MDLKTPGPRIFRSAILWSAAVAMLVLIAYPAWAIIFAPKNSVITKSIAKGAVTSIKIKNGAVKSAKIANAAITSAKIADGAIVDADIAAGAGIAATKINRAGLDADLLDGQHANDFMTKASPSWTARAGAIVVDASAFRDQSDVGTSEVDPFPLDGLGVWVTTPGSPYLVAPVNLPHGATLTGMTLYYYDGNVADGFVQLKRRALTSLASAVIATANSAGNGNVSSTSVGIAGEVVDNTANSYFLYVYLPPLVAVRAVKIDYTTTQP